MSLQELDFAASPGRGAIPVPAPFASRAAAPSTFWRGWGFDASDRAKLRQARPAILALAAGWAVMLSLSALAG